MTKINLMVPTVFVDAIVKTPFEFRGKPCKVGELISLAYGPALQLRAFGLVGGFQNEDDKHLEANEHLTIYGGDSWFPQPMQTVSRVADYLAQAGEQPTNAGAN